MFGIYGVYRMREPDDDPMWAGTNTYQKTLKNRNCNRKVESQKDKKKRRKKGRR